VGNNLFEHSLFEEQQDLSRNIFEAGIQEGIKRKRQRILEIEQLPSNGFDAIIAEAKQSGISAMDAYKLLIKAKQIMKEEIVQNTPDVTNAAKAVIGFKAYD